MRRILVFILVSSCSILFWPALAGCAKGTPDFVRRHAVDGGLPFTSVDARPQVADTGGIVHPAVAEICDGIDNDLDSHIDEDFLCPLGREGEICVTTCGANGFRVCEAPSCSWSTSCHTFDEVCDDTLDNDCDGNIDEGCTPPNPVECSGTFAGSTLHLQPSSSLGSCSAGWTLVLWGAHGAFEEYDSSPGSPLDVTIRDDWLGWAAFTAYCRDWDGVRDWSSFEGRQSSAAGVTVTLDGRPIDVTVCYDPGGGLIRPLIPVQCGLAACPGPHY